MDFAGEMDDRTEALYETSMGILFHTPEERWERITNVLLWVAGLFGAFTIYGLYSRDDWRGLVMTIAPGAICLGFWYLARARLDYMVSGASKPLWLKIVSWAFVSFGAVVLVLIVIGISVPAEPESDRQDQMLQRMNTMMKDVEVVTLPDGSKTLRRKQPPAIDEESPGSAPEPLEPAGSSR
jgi:hypothetical protein